MWDSMQEGKSYKGNTRKPQVMQPSTQWTFVEVGEDSWSRMS